MAVGRVVLIFLILSVAINKPVTNAMTTEDPTTETMTTEAMTTEAMTTEAMTTEAMTTEAMTTEAMTTEAMTTEEPNTMATITSNPAATPPITTTEAEELTTTEIIFRSVDDTFTSDLEDPTSVGFLNRAELIEGQLRPFFQNQFSSFRGIRMVEFSNGSVINSGELDFVSTAVPTGTDIANVLISAASNITGFDIEPSSITVNGIISSGVSHKISLVTASCLVLLSWLLSSQQ